MPRPVERLADCVWLCRLIFKARQFAAGALPPEFAARFCHPTGIDGHFLAFFHLTREEILAASGQDDAAVAEWFLSSGERNERIAEWNHIAVNLGRPGFPMADRLQVALASVYPHLAHRNLQTVFEVLEADDAQEAHRVMFFPIPREIETDRIRLRQWREEDFAPFAALTADPEVMRYFPATLSEEESSAYAQRCHDLIAERGWGFWAAEEKQSGEFIGFLGLHIPTAPLPFMPCVEIGWRLARKWWGKGFATEGARGALEFGFRELDLDSIVSFTALVNTRSEAVMKRLGMQREATFEHPVVPPGHVLREHCLYRLANPNRVPETDRR
ncbi:protein N-acetyltransferase, RimJ/RimL family [Terrimicrobium sacchariphilum]|uniref:Protein N-acetyltransferase, RimJ/RimL family n=2 Tax=Terrimicrobium sacchariphilum TaxID=690879 RepID=A0A146G9W3_TERSA|nr:GNAT family N-acetyltransferase [Terrimicrobium sacchariphilum]GAT34439.1 protein N-acetyltransferase, RimJ/RimL family [Terrimicrobium sacchariphilum]